MMNKCKHSQGVQVVPSIHGSRTYCLTCGMDLMISSKKPMDKRKDK